MSAIQTSQLEHHEADGQIHLWISGILSCFGLATLEPALVLAGIVSYAIIAVLRERDEPPIFIFCLANQLLYCIAGLIYRGIYGDYPSDHETPLIGTAVCLLLGSLFFMVFGINAGIKYMESRSSWRRAARKLPQVDYKISRIFGITIFFFTLSMVVKSNMSEISQAYSQLVYRVLEFRFLFLFVLFSAVMRQREGYNYAWMAGAFAAVPQLVASGSGFATSILIFLVVLLAESRLLSSSKYARRHPGRIAGIFVTAIALCLFALFWNGAMKGHWRQKLRSGQVTGSLFTQLDQFLREANDRVATMDLQRGLRVTTGRLSDVPVMMNHVVQRVPTIVPFASGELTTRAITHVLMPRFLFPNKEKLGSESTLVRRFAGLAVAGEEQNTSVALGYLVEFYIDFGIFGMMLSSFVFGALMGALSRAMIFVAPSVQLYQGIVTSMFFLYFISLDGALAKLLGAVCMAAAFQSIFWVWFGDAIHRMLQKTPARPYAPAQLQRSAQLLKSDSHFSA